MSRNFSRVLWSIAGVLLIAAGIVCLLSPSAAVTALSVFLGIAVLVSGIADIMIFVRGQGLLFGAGWFLADGVAAVILSLFLLFNRAFTTLTLPFIFGMWLLFSGITKLVNSFELCRFGVRGWGWFTALGCLLAVVGFLSFLDPILGMLAMSILIGILLILQGLSSILRAVFSSRFFM